MSDTSNNSSINTSGQANSIAGLASLYGGYAQFRASEAQGSYTKSIYEANAGLARLQAQDSIRRGEVDANKHKKKVKQLLGAQRAQMAANGIDISDIDSSAYLIEKDTLEQGYADVRTIKNNAWREAWGLSFQASQFESQGRFAQMAAKFSGTQSLISGGLQAASYGVKAYKDFNPDSNTTQTNYKSSSFNSGNYKSNWDLEGPK